MLNKKLLKNLHITCPTVYIKCMKKKKLFTKTNKKHLIFNQQQIQQHLLSILYKYKRMKSSNLYKKETTFTVTQEHQNLTNAHT